MTMANSTLSSPSRTGVSLRKTNKPLMEKRRRARINDSLSQLKSLVIQGSKKDSSQFNKLEKADILELTVKHLRNLQSQQEQTLSQANGNDLNLAGKYQAGFMECANEVIRYLGQAQGFSDDTKTRVISHLASCLQLSTKPSFVKPLQPSNITASNAQIIGSGAAQPSSTAQLPNGQIIQIVNTPFQTVKSSPAAVHYSSPQTVPIAPAPMPMPPSSSASLSSSPSAAAAANSHIPSTASPVTNSPVPVSDQSAYVRYTQPLHIQIPPVLSPVLIQSQSQKPAQSQHISRSQEMVTPQVHHPRLPTPPQETLVSTTSPSPSQLKERSISPVPLRTSLKYYTSEELTSDYAPRSRSYSMASSASSSESELTSPLNLSQSPPYYDTRKEYIRKYACQNAQQQHHSSSAYGPEKTSPTHRILRDTCQFPSSNFTSVIVDGRKSVDTHAFKLMHMDIEDERHCTRHEGSTSPASSVGEERLWRPW